MNILILTTHFNTGGITSYVLTLAKGLRKNNHKVFVVSSGGNMVADIERAGVKHVCFDIRTKSEVSPKLYRALPKLLRFIKENNIDVIHSQTRIAQVLAAILSKISPVKHVSTCHGFFKVRLFRRIFPCWGDATIAISRQVEDHLLHDFHLSSSKVFWVIHGISCDLNLLSQEESLKKRKEFGVAPGPLVGIVARLSNVKGHDILINAMRKVVDKKNDARLLVVGRGKIEDHLKEMRKNLGLEDNIIFLPIINQVDTILSILDIFVMPSRQEGLGLSVMEAQAQGLPVVASRVGGIPSLIDNGTTGILVPPENVDELAAALIYLIENPDQAKQIGQRAKVFAKENFSIQRMINQTYAVYEKVCEKTKR
ncbi:MAG: glycosyltransferase family 4 protein [Candidatus Omnitrophica bacterium]|nr:glycosyltransferase family 4 protein [Candidatus Omnitrophota bacterium]